MCSLTATLKLLNTSRNTSRNLKSYFHIKVYFVILINKWFEYDRGNFTFVLFISLFIYRAALSLSKPGEVERNYGVAAGSRHTDEPRLEFIKSCFGARIYHGMGKALSRPRPHLIFINRIQEKTSILAINDLYRSLCVRSLSLNDKAI